MIRRNLWTIILIACYVLILSGGVNAGFSMFFMSLPFMLVAVVISFNIRKWTIYTTALILCFSIVFSVTLTKNPLVFPILSNGSIEILSDGYHHSFSDGSGGFFKDSEEMEVGSFISVVKKLTKGESYKVTGIVISHPDFSSQIDLQTTVGQFSQSDYLGSSLSPAMIAPNKTVHTELFSKFSFLMAWPILFMVGFPVGLVIFVVSAFCLIYFVKTLPKS